MVSIQEVILLLVKSRNGVVLNVVAEKTVSNFQSVALPKVRVSPNRRRAGVMWPHEHGIIPSRVRLDYARTRCHGGPGEPAVSLL